jgi:hypothetical protein
MNNTVRAASFEETTQRFGAPRFSWSPTPTNHEHVTLTGGWAEGNIEAVHVPQIAAIQRSGTGLVFANRHDAAQQLLDVFDAWEHAGLLPYVLTFDGAWVPRFKRGRVPAGAVPGQVFPFSHDLSNHALGTAFDINARWNELGTPGAAMGAPGYVGDLAGIAAEHGWFWGRHFGARPDAMHFELGTES